MHRLLRRILKKSGLSPDTVPSIEGWKKFLDKLDETYISHDEDRYLLERSLEISSQEMEQLLEASKESYQRRISALIKVIPDLIFYVDEDGKYLDVLSRGKDDLLYLPRDEIIGRRIDEIFPPEYAKLFYEATVEAIRTNSLKIINYPMNLKNERCFYEARIMPTNIKENGKRTTITIVRDMTAQKKSTEYLNVIKKIFEDATEGIMIASREGHYLEVNDAFCRMLGIMKHQLPGYRLVDFRPFFDDETMENIVSSLEEKNLFHGEVTIRRRDATKLLAWLSIDTVFNEKGEATYRVAMLTDISELQSSREKLHFTATHDMLTKLPNRMHLFERLDGALKRAKRYGGKGALFFIDLDNFKEINDTAGHGAGDRVLIECSRRIKNVLRETDTFGRLGGDEFLLITENIKQADASMHVAQKILREINHPFVVGEESYDLGASIGIAFFPDDSSEAEELVQFADMAMYRAKEKGKNRFQYYSKSLDSNVKRHYMIERALKDALRRESYYLLYQPQLGLKKEKVTGVEALLRVDETILGLISPAEFIPIAEESDLIIKIGKWVFKECCRQIVRWRKEGIEDLLVAVNLSRKQLMDESWSAFVETTIQRYDVDPSNIEFEITETTFMHSKKQGYRTITSLQKMGFRFSIDDFGTGYSSLANLKQFTLDKLKIDRTFIMDIEKNESDRAIVKASIALAKALGLSTIAEGVETEKQKEILKEMGCDEMQGYLFSKPVPPTHIASLLRKRDKKMEESTS
ncbi:sensor domain-containing protein [Hydrogenimonas urashimensis]|uniref:sensor domain-containing protein n=1 Tax=Hydrogenimonas urashimensis TaxID=2740515 RepID=UPI0019157BF7|nr:EAL domain-containing protein [Hydrogenimonas urashimensis]